MNIDLVPETLSGAPPSLPPEHPVVAPAGRSGRGRGPLRRLRSSARRRGQRILERHPALLPVYYRYGSRAFSREQSAVLAGRLRHQAQLDDVASQRFLLRRNIHRLEKGLLMRPRREVFAADYVGETVRAFEVVSLAAATEGLVSLVLDRDWAGDVLEEYFTVVGSHSSVDAARSRFLRVARPLTVAPRRVPYRRDLSVADGPSYDALAALASRRRSVRWFRQEPVDRDLVDHALVVGLQAPSACNRQPFRFLVFDEPELVHRVVELPRGTPGYAHNIPMIVVVVGQLRAFFHERDRHLIYIDASLASMGFMLALETLGLSSCPINWPDVEPLEQRMAELLSLEPDERVVMLIAVGKPDDEGMVAFSQKRSLEDIRSYNQVARP